MAMAVLLLSACQYEYLEAPVVVDEDCGYEFTTGIADIYGAWEPIIVVDLESGDSTFYEPGASHMGFMLEKYYADSYELRPGGVFALYYASVGRPCADDSSGLWKMDGSQITFYGWQGDTAICQVHSIKKHELIIEDIVNFKPSVVVNRRAN